MEKNSPEKQLNAEPYLLTKRMSMYQLDLVCWHGDVATLPSPWRWRQLFCAWGRLHGIFIDSDQKESLPIFTLCLVVIVWA